MDVDRGDIALVRTRMERAELGEGHFEDWMDWPVHWSGIWVGALGALALALIFGLVGIAVGAHQAGPARALARPSDFGTPALIFSVLGAFFSFVLGGWIAGRLTGLRNAERGALHGAIVWLVSIPIFLLMAAFGATSLFGGWYGGLAGTPIWVTPSATIVDPVTLAAARNSALGALTAMLIGLIGAVLGGWMASGEPMMIARRAERDRELQRAA